MIISNSRKFVFVKTSKTAGTSIEVYLSDYCTDDDVVTPIFPAEPGHISRNYGDPIITNPLNVSRQNFQKAIQHHIFRNHMSSSEIKHLIGEEKWGAYFSFCVERNPWDKAVSHYYMQRARGLTNDSFEKHCLDRQFPSDATKWFHSRTNEVQVDRIVRYENLSVELAEIFSRLDIPFEHGLNVRAKSEYRAERPPYQTFFINNEMVDAVAEKCQTEINLLGYDFD